MIPPTNTLEQVSLDWRSFDVDLRKRKDEWLGQLSKYESAMFLYQPYDLLAPLRSWSGRNLIRQEMEAKSKMEIVQAVLEAIKSDYLMRMDDSILEPIGLNESLAQLFASNLEMQSAPVFQ